MKKYGKWIVGCVLLCALIIAAFLLWKPAHKYSQAKNLMEQSAYKDAVPLLTELGEYRDSETLLETCYLQICGEETYEMVRNLKAGERFFYGSYEQDGDLSNGPEPIEWIVLKKEGMGILLVSRYGLDCQPYYGSYTEVTWEDSTLRAWLNNAFWEEAFSSQEREWIGAHEVPADQNTIYEGTTDPGETTKDNVFLLSASEAEQYLDERKCLPTKYASSQGVLATGVNGECKWWTRTPGRRQYDVSTILPTGFIDSYGDGANTNRIAVRPAIWVDFLGKTQ